VDVSIFYDAFDQSFERNHGLRNQVFFDKEHYGVDRLVPITLNDYLDPSFVNQANNVPLSERARAELLKLLTKNQRSLKHLNRRQRREFLGSISIEQFLREHLGCGDEVVHLLGKMTLDYWALGIDALSARDAVEMWLPGFGGLLRQRYADEEPYIFHFPDGNASVARLLVKKLIPGIT
jgi:spermidine dehydrogenase